MSQGLLLYLDYHGVIDVSDLKAMAKFMRGLKNLDSRAKFGGIHKTLLSFAPSPHRIKTTLETLMAARIATEFDQIVFTELALWAMVT